MRARHRRAQALSRRIRRQAAGAAAAPGARLDLARGRCVRYLALTLDRKATHSGFYRRIDYPQHGVV
jgi:hypothetical protein